MKKIFSLFVLMLTVIAVNAMTKKIYPTFASVNNSNISWSLSDKKFTISGDENYKGGNNTYQIFSFPAGTLTADTKIHINIPDKDNTRVLFMNGSTTVYTWQGFYSAGLKYLNMNAINDAVTNNLANITSIRIAGPATGSSVVETPIYLNVDPDELYLEIIGDEGMQITTPIAQFEWYNYSTDKVYGHSASQLSKQLGKEIKGNNQMIFGPYSTNATTAYMNVSGYDHALVTLSTAGAPGIRFMYNTSTNTVETDVNNKFYTQDLSSMPKIATIKTKNGSDANSFTIGSIDFYKFFKSSSTTSFNIAESLSSTVNYDRTFTAGQKSTVCLPFALTTSEVSAAGTFYELTNYDGTTLTFSPVTETVAYKPYLFEANATGAPFSNLTNKEIVASSGATTEYPTNTNGGYTATFTGTLSHQSVNGKYGWNSSNGTFSKATADAVTIDAFRAYITVSGTASARGLTAVFSDDDATGIETVKQAQTENDVMYNLAGQRVNSNHKGLVIKNGRKYFVK